MGRVGRPQAVTRARQVNGTVNAPQHCKAPPPPHMHKHTCGGRFHAILLNSLVVVFHKTALTSKTYKQQACLRGLLLKGFEFRSKT